jgi:hypothetical protein
MSLAQIHNSTQIAKLNSCLNRFSQKKLKVYPKRIILIFNSTIFNPFVAQFIYKQTNKNILPTYKMSFCYAFCLSVLLSK